MPRNKPLPFSSSLLRCFLFIKGDCSSNRHFKILAEEFPVWSSHEPHQRYLGFETIMDLVSKETLRKKI